MRIYDCFMFFNELDLLDIRLNELDPVVDYFVLVESTKTFSGQPKQLWYKENLERYREYADKIIHIVIDDMPEIRNGNRWELEHFQRRQILRGLDGAQTSDMIMLSDVDEIPDQQAIRKVVVKLSKVNKFQDKKELASRSLLDIEKSLLDNNEGTFYLKVFRKLRRFVFPKQSVYLFLQRHHEYFLNGFIHASWPGTVITRFSTFANVFNLDCLLFRELRTGGLYEIEYGGWHFTYLGGVDKIIEKIHAFGHSEFDTEIYTNAERIASLMQKGKNLYDKEGEKHTVSYIEIDHTFPTYIQKNRERLKKYIKDL